VKYKCIREYRKISDVLHIHFQKIVFLSKNQDQGQLSKIPFPVRLEEEECHTKLLELRYQQLKVAL